MKVAFIVIVIAGLTALIVSNIVGIVKDVKRRKKKKEEKPEGGKDETTTV